MVGLAIALGTLSTVAADVNYDEANVGNLPLPDPLKMEDGRAVANAAMWYRFRRPEILRLFQREVYGKPLPRPTGERFRVESEILTRLSGLSLK